MQVFRHKPTIVYAARWLGDNSSLQKVGELIEDGPGFLEHENGTDLILVSAYPETPDLIVHVGDWVVKGIDGHLYPCTNKIFNQIYEAVL